MAVRFHALSALPHPDFHHAGEPVFQDITATRTASTSPPAAPPVSFDNPSSIQVQPKQSLTSLETLPVWPLLPGMPHYIVMIPKDSSSRSQCFFCDDSGAYKHIQVNLAQFAGGHHASFDMGLEVGRMSVVENLFMMDKAQRGVKIGEADNEGSRGAKTTFTLRISESETITLPIPTDTPHFVIWMPREGETLHHPQCLVYDKSQRMHTHIKELTEFTDANHAAFLAGVEVGKMLLLENPYIIDEARRLYARYCQVHCKDEDEEDMWDQLSMDGSENEHNYECSSDQSDVKCEDKDHSPDSVHVPPSSEPKYTVKLPTRSGYECMPQVYLRVKSGYDEPMP